MSEFRVAIVWKDAEVTTETRRAESPDKAIEAVRTDLRSCDAERFVVRVEVLS